MFLVQNYDRMGGGEKTNFLPIVRAHIHTFTSDIQNI